MKFENTKAFLALADSGELDRISGLLQGMGLDISGAVSVGGDAVSGAVSTGADLVIADYILPGEDGLEVCRKLKGLANPPAVIVLSPYISELVSAQLKTSEADCFLLKPVSPDKLALTVSNCAEFRGNAIRNGIKQELELRISEMLREIGIPVRLMGYRCIADALLTVRESTDCIHGKTEEMYKYLARRHGTTPRRVERNMRSAITVAFDRCTPSVMEKYFGNTVSFDRARPTNGEFLACLAEKLIFEFRLCPFPSQTSTVKPKGR